MMRKRVSIILPVYNVEPYVERCVRSLMNQDLTHDEYEVIAVNDGSPDNSRNLVVKLQSEFNNLVLVDQENQGVSIARNVGIDRAEGQYLLFIDPDDYVEAGTLGRIVKEAEHHDLDVFFLGYQFLDVQSKIIHDLRYQQHAGKLVDGIDAYFLARGNGKVDPDRAVGVLFKRSFMNEHHLRYISKVPYLEDGELLARIMCLAKRCMFWGHSFYVRTTRSGSATNSDLFYSDRSIEGFFRAAQSLRTFQKQAGLTTRQRSFLNQPICKFVLLVVIPLCSVANRQRFWQWIDRLRAEGFTRLELKGLQRYYYLEGWMYQHLPFLLWLHRVLRMPLFKILPNTQPSLAP